MIIRIFFSLVFGFVLSVVSLLVFPDLGRAAGPLLCAGTLESEFRPYGLRYTCAEPSSGVVTPVETEQVLVRSIPILSAVLAPLLMLGLGRAVRTGEVAQRGMHEDLARALEARAEILRIDQRGNFRQQMILRASDLRLVLWVQPPSGRPYEATTAWLVEEHCLKQFTVGAMVAVRINPLRPEKVYPVQAGVHYTSAARIMA